MNTRVMDKDQLNHLLKQENDELIEKLASGDESQIKEASEKMGTYTRRVLRETSFVDVVIPPEDIKGDNSRLVWKADDEKLYIGDEMEPGSFGAASVPFNGGNVTLTLFGSRYETPLFTIQSPRMEKHVDILATYRTELRSVILDMMVKDLQTKKDQTFMKPVNKIVGPPNTVMASTGAVQNRDMGGVLNRNTYFESLKLLQTIIPDGGLQSAAVLMNSSTVYQFGKMDRTEFGGDIAQDNMLMGFSKRQMGGVNILVTIKRSLVEDGALYHFAGPEFLGKNYIYRDTTVFTTQRELYISMFAMQTCGATIANIGGVLKTKFLA